jgi:heavy metal sensor kinase
VGTISLRIALLLGALLAALVGALGAGLYAWEREGLERDRARELDLLARLLAERLGPELEAGSGRLGPDARRQLSEFLGTTGARAELRGRDGAVLFSSSGPADAGAGMMEQTVAVPGSPEATLRVALSAEPVRARLRGLALYLGVLAPIGVVAAVLVGLVVVRRTLVPFEAIRLQAEQISRTNLSERIPEPGSAGEVRDLVCTFNAMLERLQAAIQDLEGFTADAAHELRTPLANLRAEIETAIQTSHSAEEHERILESVQAEVARMNRVVVDLFVMAKMDQRQYALQKEPVHLRALLEEARETWQPMASERGIEITTEGRDAEVLGDAVALRRVFMNLLENAVKFNRDGGRVTLSLEHGDRSVQVRVRDTGIGIPAEHLPKLFKRFYRVDKARSRESGGAGLGLAICKSFIDSHEGKIAVWSTPGEGSIFTVELPAR